MANPRMPSLDDVRELGETLRRNPYAFLAGGVGLGFVLGGGLFTRLTGKFVGAALRIGIIAALPLLKNELGRFGVPGIQVSDSDNTKGAPL